MTPLPSNLPAEKAAVSILAEVESAITAYPWREELFHDGCCRTLFRHILEARGKGEPTDLISLTARLEGCGELDSVGGAYGVTDVLCTLPLFRCEDPGIVENFHREIVDAAARREVVLLALRHDADLRTGRMGAEEFAALVAEAAMPPESKKRESLKDQIGSLLDEIENRTPPEAFGFGISPLDKELDGGFQRGELATVAGPTGGGKSLLLSQAALLAAQSGKTVAFFSLEMPAKAILRRFVANRADCPLPKPHEKPPGEQMRKIAQAVLGVSRLPLTILNNLHSLAEIESEARRLAKTGKADVVVVDYVQRVRFTGPETREQAVSEITARMKSLALQSDCAVLTASQLNRQGDVRESAAIEFDSDLVLKITDDSIFCQKFRRGPSNWAVPVTMRGDLGRFEVRTDKAQRRAA